ncbi:hypothetical protein [Streptomyces malaysiensis]|uniref:hypothetical protein n=1 Tax=Streptomyces malaysiensis TaxID=92644 RepID=UPI002B2EBB21|nr:hypothetical protein R8789_08540 [Streptomyces malaysiensis]
MTTHVEVRVDWVEQPAEGIRGLRLVRPEGEPLALTAAGDHLQLTLPSGLQRCCSGSRSGPLVLGL